MLGRNYSIVNPTRKVYSSVGAAEVEPQIGIVPVRAPIISQAVEFVAVQCGGGLHALALLALAWGAMRVDKHHLCHLALRFFWPMS